MFIIANMIARNEASNYLPQVLDRLSKQVDLICFTDDCSTDETVDVALSYGAEVQVMPEPTFVVNEGKLRQASWSHLETFVEDPANTFILAIDADEELYETFLPLGDLLSEKFTSIYNVFNVQFYHMWSKTHYRVDKYWKPHGSSRLFKYKPEGTFSDRKIASGSEPSYVKSDIANRKFMVSTGLVMKHLSYIEDEDKKLKYERYCELDGGAYHAGSHIKSIMDPLDVVKLEEWIW